MPPPSCRTRRAPALSGCVTHRIGRRDARYSKTFPDQPGCSGGSENRRASAVAISLSAVVWSTYPLWLTGSPSKFTPGSTTLPTVRSWKLSALTRPQKWSIQKLPARTRASFGELNGISCTSSSACTAVGYKQKHASVHTYAGHQPMIERHS